MHGYDADYYINNKSLNWFEPIIIEWLKIHRDYIETFDYEDSLYWYNERANISTLAGAVWKCSGFAIEEFSSEKGVYEEKSQGRIDMYLSLADNDAVIEAKLKWLNMNSAEEVDFLHIINQTHDTAKGDIKRTMAQEPAHQGIAISFVVPYWKSGKNVDLQMLRLRNEIVESDSSICAWFQNKTGNDLKNNKGNIFNCVALIGDLA